MLVLDNFIGNLWQNFLKFVKNNLILCICAAILIVLLIVGLIAFRFNYRTQMRVSVLMDNESDTFNKPGLVKYFQEYGGKLASPALVVVHLQNLNFLYQSYPKRHQLMVTVADQMLKGLGARETVGRAEFDRFIVLLDKSNLEDIKTYCRKVEDRLNNLEVEGYGKYNYSPRFGVMQNVKLSEGDLALTKAKSIFEYSNSNDGNIFYFTDVVTTSLERRNKINLLKEDALKNNQFQAFVTPKVSLADGQVVGGKLSLKWSSLDGNSYLPDEYEEIFEQSGFIAKLDLYAVEQACSMSMSMMQRGYGNVIISTRISKASLESGSFSKDLQNVVVMRGANPRNIELDIADYDPNDRYGLSQIMAIKQMGFRVGIDNFGRNNASFEGIVEHYFDAVNVDNIFFSRGMQSESDVMVVQNIIDMLLKMNVDVTLLGVNSNDVLDTIASISHDVNVAGGVFSGEVPAMQFDSVAGTNYSSRIADVSVQAVKAPARSSRKAQPAASAQPSNSEIEELRSQIDLMRQEMLNRGGKDNEDAEKKHRDEIEKLRQELLANSKSKNNDDAERRHREEIEKLRQEMLAASGKNKSDDDAERRHRDEVERLRRELDEANRSNQDREVERLRRELDEANRSNKDREVDDLRRQIDDLRRNQNTGNNNQNNQQPYPGYPYGMPYGMPYGYPYGVPMTPQAQQIDVDELIKKISKKNEETIQEAMEKNRKETAAMINKRLEEEKKEREELEGILNDIVLENQAKELEKQQAKEEEALNPEEEQRKADSVLNLDLSNLSYYDEPDMEEELEEDDEDENFDETKNPELTLDQIEAIIGRYQEKYHEDWNQKAKEELKGGYNELINALKYYQQRERMNFVDRVKRLTPELKQIYNIVKNELMRYDGTTNRLTNNFDVVYRGVHQIAKLSFSKNKVKAYLAVNPNQSKYDKYPHKDVGDKKRHEKTPFYMLIKSQLSIKRFSILVADMMEEQGCSLKENYKPIDYATKYKFFKRDQKQ